jgi:hypothetical protein
MRAWLRLAAGLLAAAAISACSNPLGRQYEYDEQTYLSVDGSAVVVVNTSLPALVALRGAAIDPSADGTADRDGIRRLYEAAGCSVNKVGRFWYRGGRRFVQVEVESKDLGALSKCALLSWSAYSLAREDNPAEDQAGPALRYRQTVQAAAGGNPGTVNWDGSELIAFKLHVPSRIRWQNVRRLDGATGTTERGNILTWEQRLADRLAGKPIEMHVVMDQTSILYTTIWLFVGAFGAAVAVLGAAILLTVRRGRKQKLARSTQT